MTTSEIHADPVRIQGLADELRTLVGNIRAELEKMNSEFLTLGSTWRDQDYEKFKRSFDRLKEEIEKIAQEISRREPKLKEDVQTLLAYINKNMS